MVPEGGELMKINPNEFYELQKKYPLIASSIEKIQQWRCGTPQTAIDEHLDGKYLKSIHKKYGKVKLRKWRPDDAGFNLGIKEIFYYALIKRIQVIPLLYYIDYLYYGHR